jgi:hypothetical protein
MIMNSVSLQEMIISPMIAPFPKLSRKYRRMRIMNSITRMSCTTFRTKSRCID